MTTLTKAELDEIERRNRLSIKLMTEVRAETPPPTEAGWIDALEKRLLDARAHGYILAGCAQIAEVLALIAAARRGMEGQRFRHRKDGTDYRVIGEARLKSSVPLIMEGDIVVVYRAESDGTLWVRPRDEFYDGRFGPLPPPPNDQGGER